MPPMGGPRGAAFLTEEEQENRPKITGALLKRVFSYLLPYWKQLLLRNTQIFIDAIDTYKHLEGVPYDFSEDKKDKYCAARLADLTIDQPLELFQFLTDSPSSILDISRAIVNQFKSVFGRYYLQSTL